MSITPPPGPTVPVAGPHRRVRRRWWAVAFALLLVGLIAATQVPALLRTAGPAARTSVWNAITAGITGDIVPRDVALEAFAYVYGIDIPGVTVPAGVAANDRPTSGSGVYRWVHAHWAELTPEQHAAVDRVTQTHPGDRTVAIDRAALATRGDFALAAARLPRGDAGTAADLPSADLQAAMEQDLATDIQHIAGRLGVDPIPGNLPGAPNVTLIFTDQSGGGAILLTHPVMVGFGHYEPCQITAYRESWQGEAVTSGGGVSPRLHELMTHEVVHCYQNVAWGDQATALAIPAWITEGTAFYLAQEDTATAESILPDTWRLGWFGRPEQPLTNRTYDAFGFYNLLDHEGRNLWGDMEKAWEAAAKGPERSNAFIAVWKGDDPDVRDAWAPGLVRNQDWGDAWVTTGFGLPDNAQVPVHQATAGAAPGYDGTLLSRSNTVLDVTQSAGEVVLVATDGIASAHDQGANEALAFATRRFCVEGECICPPGTAAAGEHMTDQSMTLPFTVAINAPLGGAKYAVVGARMADLCGRPKTPEPQANPCPQGCPGSNGDPHLFTVNNYKYDFQAAGEFTLLRSTDGNIEIQARQEPHDAMPVSTNTAVAVKVAGHRAGVYLVDDKLQVRVDGSTIDASAVTAVGEGGRIAAYPNGLEIDFPDGTKLWTLSAGLWGINAVVAPSPQLATGVGLLGRIVPGGMGVPALPDGTRLPVAPDRQTHNTILYGRFADAWRVTDQSSLFDYDAGKSTDSYTQRDFPPPAQARTYDDLTAEERAPGDAACGSITDANLHEDCVFDVAVTGDAGFATAYAPVQRLYDAGFESPTSTPGPTGSPAPAPTQGSPQGSAVALGPATFLDGQAVGPDNRVYASVQASDTQFTILEIDAATGSVVQRATVPAHTPLHVAAGSVWAPGLDTDSHGNTCSVTRFDAGTLARQATIPAICSGGYTPQVGSDGTAVFFIDPTNLNLADNSGVVLRRIDPATNQPSATGVPLPFLGGHLVDSQGALFYYESGKHVYRLRTGATTFEDLGATSGKVYPAGTAVWVGSGQTAQLLGASTPTSVSIPGGILAAGPAGVYAEQLGSDSRNHLFRYGADGSAPAEVAVAPSQGGGPWSFFPDPQPVTGPGGLAKFWLVRADGGGTPTLYMQWVPFE